MAKDKQAIELQEIYQQADAECRRKIVEAAAELLKAQKALENAPNSPMPKRKPPKKE